jgi:hypothetical protein
MELRVITVHSCVRDNALSGDVGSAPRCGHSLKRMKPNGVILHHQETINIEKQPT